MSPVGARDRAAPVNSEYHSPNTMTLVSQIAPPVTSSAPAFSPSVPRTRPAARLTRDQALAKLISAASEAQDAQHPGFAVDPVRAGRQQREEQYALQRGQDPHRPQHRQLSWHRDLQPDRGRGAGRDLPAPLPLVRRRQVGCTAGGPHGRPEDRGAGLLHAPGDDCSSSPNRLCTDARSSGLFPSFTNPWCGQPVAVSRTRPGTPATTSPDPGSGRHCPGRVPVAAVRAGNHPQTGCCRGRTSCCTTCRPAPAAVRWRGAGQDAGRRPGGRSRAAARALSPRSSQSRPDHRPGGPEYQQMPHAGGVRRTS